MPKYIKVEDAIEAASVGCCELRGIFADIKKQLEAIPTADVVEVVRCKDCLFWKLETDPIGIECESGEAAHYCNLESMITRSGDFCNYGRRRDDAVQ